MKSGEAKREASNGHPHGPKLCQMRWLKTEPFHLAHDNVMVPPHPGGREVFLLRRRLHHWQGLFISIVPAFPHPSSCPAFAPRPLRRFLTTMRALTPRRSSAPPGSPSLTQSCFRTSCRQPPDALPSRSFIPFPAPDGLTVLRHRLRRVITPHGYGLRHWLACSPMHLAESRSFPAGRPFPSRCSPPRLAATQLRSGTNLKGSI